MPSSDVKSREKQIAKKLAAPRVLRGIEEVIALAAGGCENVSADSLRDLPQEREQLAEAEFHKRVSRDVYLILQTHEPGPAAQIGRGRGGIERAQAKSPRVVVVEQKIAKQNVRWSEVHLRVKNVAGLPARGLVLSFGQVGNNQNVIVAVQAVRKPGATFENGPGKIGARRPRTQVKALLRIQAWNEVRGGVAESIIAVFGFDLQRACRALAELRRVAAAEVIERLHRFHAHVGIQQAC